ncbi:MAG: alpha/beta fold hydrolase [Ignavibacteriales bacterium]|nr:alpha/beta fold hydrolase [Ignavibacteriales bacterium]
MKIFKTLFLILFFSLISLCKVEAKYELPENGKVFVGTWLGKLKIQSFELKIVFRIDMKEEKLTALIDSPDQGAKDIPVDEVLFTGDSLFLNSILIKGKFEGLLFKDSMKIVGVWKQGGGTFPLEVKKVDKVEEPKRPQEPKPPYPYNSDDIIFENTKASIKLAGTLTYPKDGKNFPAVVMLSGSGPQDRNEMVFNHKPFLIIADYLTKNGIAVLRFDDRGTGASTGDFRKGTTKDFAEDVECAVEYLRTRKEINQKKIGLIGHSEGGIIAPMVAINNKDIAFIVLLAGTGIPGDELLALQAKLIMEAEGEKSEKAELALNLNKKLYAVLKSESDTTLIRQKTETLLKEYYNSLNEEDKKQIPDLNQFINQQVKTLSSPWFKYFISFDPRPTLQKVTCPVLALNGEKDLQVPPKENLSAIEAALKKGKNKNYKIIELPGLNHLFQPTKTGKISEYQSIEETFSPNALEIIGNWIKEVIQK